jgi:hypothetical protein
MTSSPHILIDPMSVLVKKAKKLQSDDNQDFGTTGR